MIANRLQNIGRKTLGLFQRIGHASLFLLHVLSGIKDLLLRPRLLVQQVHSVGVLSLLIIVFSGLSFRSCRSSQPGTDS